MTNEEIKATLAKRKFVQQAAYAPMTAAEFVAGLKRLYLFYFAEDFVEERMEVPADYLQFLEEVGGDWVQGGNWAYIGSAALALSMTASYYDIFDGDFFRRKQKKTPISTDTMWVQIGNWSDKHDWIMCVEKGHPSYGKVIDAYDDHPFLHEDFLDDGVYANFYDFIRYEEE